MLEAYAYPITGGLLIGISATLMMLLNGRIAGVSGIFWGAITEHRNSFWRIAFIIGLPLGAYWFHLFSGALIPVSDGSVVQAILGGLLVGFGVKLGSGCTSGHGVCGIARLSVRSLVATVIFMLAGIVTVTIVRHFL
jgi:uncharacterized membrane protein YedE/YeeE